MKAAFQYAVRYRIEAVCQTPFRTADADGDTELVLRNADGSAMIQGTSLAGAFREWVHTRYPKEETALFGGQQTRDSEALTAGALYFSDGIFEADLFQVLRPRVRIDRKTGTAADGAKFDIAHIPVGSKFTFTITCLTQAQNPQAEQTITEMLEAMHCGDILLGGQKSNGFGRVSLQVFRSSYNMKNEADRERWIHGTENSSELVLRERKPASAVTFTFRGNLGSVLVKSGTAKIVPDSSVSAVNMQKAGTGKSEQSSVEIAVNMKEAGRNIIPGSSLKGVLRGRMEKISNYLLGNTEPVTQLLGRGAADGDNGLAGRVRFEDVVLEDTVNTIHRIRINRFTGGVMQGALFTEEPVCSGFSFTLNLPEEDPAACALLFYALRDLGMQLYGLGSGSSTGKGLVKNGNLKITTATGAGAEVQFTPDCRVLSGEALLQGWLQELEEMRHGSR